MTKLWIGTGRRPDPSDPDIWKRLRQVPYEYDVMQPIPGEGKHSLLRRVWKVDTSKWVVPGAEWANRPR